MHYKIKKQDFAFILAFGINYFICMLYSSKIENFLGLIPLAYLTKISYVIIFIVIGAILLQNIKTKFLFYGIILLFVLCGVSYYSNNLTLMLSSLFIFSAYRLDLEKFFKAIFWENTLIIVLFFLCSILCIIPANNLVHNGITTYSFGFVASNTFAIAIFRSELLWGLISFERIKYKHILLLTIINVIVFIFSNSRIVFYTSLIYVIMLLYYKLKKNAFESKIFLVIAELLMPLFTFLSFYFGSIYLIWHNELQQLNELFSGRLYFINYYLTQYGVTLWGNSVELISVRESVASGRVWFGLDNSYVYSLVSFGIVVTIINILLISFLIYRAYKSKNKRVLLYIIPMLLVGMTENGIFYSTFNCVLIYLINIHFLQLRSPFEYFGRDLPPEPEVRGSSVY